MAYARQLFLLVLRLEVRAGLASSGQKDGPGLGLWTAVLSLPLHMAVPLHGTPGVCASVQISGHTGSVPSLVASLSLSHLFKGSISNTVTLSKALGELGIQHVNLGGHNSAHNTCRHANELSLDLGSDVWFPCGFLCRRLCHRPGVPAMGSCCGLPVHILSEWHSYRLDIIIGLCTAYVIS